MCLRESLNEQLPSKQIPSKRCPSERSHSENLRGKVKDEKIERVALDAYMGVMKTYNVSTMKVQEKCHVSTGTSRLPRKHV